MEHLRIYSPSDLTDGVLAVLEESKGVSNVALLRGASLQPPGDVILTDAAREAVNDIVERLHTIGFADRGAVQLERVSTWMSRTGLHAEEEVPGAGDDAVVWVDVIHRAYEDSTLTWTFATFLTLATVIASIGIVLDSQILIVGAMVVGPEFGAVAALGVALVRRRYALLRRALRTLMLGFAIAIAIGTLAALVVRALGWITMADVAGPRPFTQFIYAPDRWSLVVALIAGAVGVLSMTSAKTNVLVGVFISVTTVPAAGNLALALAFGAWAEVWGSTQQLAVNITGMALAGWFTLVLQQAAWHRVLSRRRLR